MDPGAAVGELPAPGTADPPAGGATPEAPVPPPVQSLITLRSEPPGAVFELNGKALPAARLPSPDPGRDLEVRAVLGCQEATRRLSAADAGTEVVLTLSDASLETEVISEPAGANLLVDGKSKGRTPARLTLDACKAHTLAARKEGFKDWSRELALSEGRLQAPAVIEASLVPLPRGTLLVPTPPYPVEMELEGGRLLKAGEKTSLVAATYRLTITSQPLLLRRQVRVTVAADRSVTPDIAFPAVARLTVRAQPSNAKIEAASDGGRRDLGPPPVLAEELVAGTYNVKCTFAHNGEVQEKTVTLAEGENPAVVFVAGRP
jgi:hypothetical protein